MEINKKLLLTVCLVIPAFSFVLAQLIRPGIEQLSNAMPSNTAQTEEIQPGRWTFIGDPASPDAQRKAAILKRIDQFWSDFKASQENLKFIPKLGKENTFAVDWMSKNLHKIDPRIEWEMSLTDSGDTELDICPAGHTELRPIIATLLERADKIPGWKFTGFRQPIQAHIIESAFMARCNEPLPVYRAQLNKNKQNNIDVTVYSPAFKGENRKEDLEKAFLLTDLILGEENVDAWVRQVSSKAEVEKQPTLDSFDFTRASENFASSFNKLKTEIQAALPDKYYYQIPWSDKVGIISATKEEFVKAKNIERYRFSIISPFANLLRALASASLNYSENYSKYNEKFGYLHIITSASDEFDDKRPELEKDLDDLLRQKKLGCVIASGRGKPDSYYFDLCLTDINKALPVLQSFCQEKKLPTLTWLRFYDNCWTYEWVEMLPTTPPLKNPELIW